MEGERLRVLMLAPTPYFADRGCHVRIYEEARALIRDGFDVRIVTYHIGRDMPGIPTSRIPSVPWYRKLAAGPSWHKPYLDVLLLAKSFTVARQWHPHIIHAHLHEGACIGWFLKKMLRLPLVFDCQGSLTTEMLDHGFMGRGGILHRLFAMMERMINRRADCIITSSQSGCHDLQENWQVEPERVSALMDGVDVNEFHPSDGNEMRTGLGLPIDRPVAAFLGVLNRYQGVDLLMEVIHGVKRAGEPLHFLIMGFPAEEYQKRAEREGISDSVTFTGRVDYTQVSHYLAAADIALSPKVSRTEANGKLLNYLACGLPCLVFETPVNREILGEDGVYAAFGDADDFAAKLLDLARNPDKRAELAARSRARAVREHSWQVRGQELAQVYRRVLEEQ